MSSLWNAYFSPSTLQQVMKPFPPGLARRVPDPFTLHNGRDWSAAAAPPPVGGGSGGGGSGGGKASFCSLVVRMSLMLLLLSF